MFSLLSTILARRCLGIPCAALALGAFAVIPGWSDEPAKKPAAAPQEQAETKSAADAKQAELIKKLEETLTGCKMLGGYTVTGKTDLTPKPEEYTITSATKLEEPDLWLIKARIRYGKNDKTIPIPLEIKWAGDTPVITLTNLTIPGMGTFSSRVVIYEGRYAGTWQHDKVGGHLYGTLEKLSPDDQ